MAERRPKPDGRVSLWCAVCRRYVEYRGWVDEDGATHVTAPMLAAHRAQHAALADRAR
ncbi:hypothetical protein NSA53_17300 [Cellulosimicrobium cellulans]|uniref:hypothetical protein n=1 Tax=Cellulosimicrobium cellulans TaxID=1710 RepID=UPI002149E409|nr:hypothetical protein [Cellulosimicrobium cellulans]